MVPEIGCVERILFEDKFPIIVVQLVKLSYDITRRD